MIRFAALTITIILTTLIWGCQKDQAKISQLEKETLAAEAVDYTPQAPERDKMRASDSTTLRSRDYAMSPDKVPEEFPSVESKKKRTNAPIISLATAEAKVTAETVPVLITSKPQAPSNQLTTVYSVQIGSTVSHDEANLLAGQFRSRGYDTYLSEAKIKGVTYYRVRIGNFDSLAKARKLGVELQDKYSVKFWVAKSS